MSCKPTDLWEVKLGLASTGHVVFEDQLSEREMNYLIDAFQQSLEAKEDMDVTVRTNFTAIKGDVTSGKEVKRSFKKRLIIPYSVIKGCIVITILAEEKITEGQIKE